MSPHVLGDFPRRLYIQSTILGPGASKPPFSSFCNKPNSQHHDSELQVCLSMMWTLPSTSPPNITVEIATSCHALLLLTGANAVLSPVGCLSTCGRQLLKLSSGICLILSNHWGLKTAAQSISLNFPAVKHCKDFYVLPCVFLNLKVLVQHPGAPHML